MSRFDDGYESPDGSEDTDPLVRELRTEIVRLEAQLDQLSAGLREQTAEYALLRNQLVELQRRVEALRRSRRRDAKLVLLAWALAVASVAFSLYVYLTT